MECLVCHNDGGYNRVVVELASGLELGGLCVNCERQQLGELSDELGGPRQERCLFCHRDGLWAVPKWMPSTYETQEGTVSYVDYDASTASIKLCDEHLAKLGVREVPAPVRVGEKHDYTKRIVEE